MNPVCLKILIRIFFAAALLSVFKSALAQVPAIRSFLPTSARSGSFINIKGTGFQGVTAVSFGGVPAGSFYLIADTLIQAIVDTGASGSITISTPRGTSSLAGFTFLAPPVVSSFTPDSSFSGMAILIKGKNFTGTRTVTFGETPAASFTINSDTTITAIVGYGTSGLVALTTPNGTGYASGFTYLGPSIFGFSPQSGGAGTLVTITGVNFTGASAVSFGGVPAASFTLVSDNNIKAVVGNGAPGDVSVTTPSGIGIKNGFTAPPFITNISPTSAPAGAVVTLTGNSLSSLSGATSVYFGTARAAVTAVSATSLTAVVPAGGNFAPITVTANSLTGYSARPFITTYTGGALVPASYALKQLLINGTGGTVAIGDVNRDAMPDIVAPRPGGIAVYKNSSNNGSVLFDTAIITLTGTAAGTASAIALADLNMDGGLDVITAGTAQNSVSVYRNLNSGSRILFFSGINFTVGSGSAYALTVGDLDKDGKPDVVVSNSGSSSLSILRNTSVSNSIAFAPKSDLTTLTAPRLAFVEDIDQDGKQDIVVMNTASASFSIFRNITPAGGTLSFAARRDISVGIYSSIQHIAVADMDGDGLPDIVVNSTGICSVFRNTSTAGSISFTSQNDFINPGGGAGNININDVDGDGKPDIILNYIVAGTANLYKNNSAPGTMNFEAPVGYPIPTLTNNIYTADLNTDGKTDLILANSEGFYYLRNKFNEPPVITTFSPQTASVGDTIIITGTNLTGATIASFRTTAFNSFTVLTDKSIAAVVSAGSGGAVSVTTPYGSSSVGNLTVLLPPIITGFAPLTAAVGATISINGSGFSPVAANNTVLFGTMKATVTSATSNNLTVLVPASVSHQHVSVTVNSLTASSSLFFSTIFPSASPVFTSYYFDTTNSITLSGINGVRAIHTGDIDGDGKLDITMNTYDGNFKTTILKNNSDGSNISFAPRILLPNGGSNSLLLTDMDGDGQPDLVTGNYTGSSLVAIYKNNSTPGTLSLAPDFLLYRPLSTDTKIRTADIDQDGRPDIILRGQYDTRVILFRNTSTNGVSSYSSPFVVGQVSTGSGVDYDADIQVEDFSGDGRPDIAVLLTSGLLIFKNTGAAGNISFAPQSIVYSAYSSRNGIVSDFDGDGRVDIAVVYNQPNALSISRNISTNGNIAFARPVVTPLEFIPYRIAIGDLDGDGKPDLSIGSSGVTNSFSIFKNTSAADTIMFASPANFTGNIGGPVNVNDLDSDGKPDILLANEQNNRIQIWRNTIGEPIPLLLCPPVASASISSGITGASYQWQVNTGSGFTNLTDNSNYAGTSTSFLQLKDVPSSWYGYQYRCTTISANSNISVVQFANKWNGAAGNAWENAANWSCGAVPDANTDVIINSGAVTINSSVTIRSLRVRQGATVNVKGNNILTVLH